MLSQGSFIATDAAVLLEISVCCGFFETACYVRTMYLELRKYGSLVGDMSCPVGFAYGVLAWYKVPHKNVVDSWHGTRTHEVIFSANGLILLALRPIFAPIGDTPYTKRAFFRPQRAF